MAFAEGILLQNSLTSVRSISRETTRNRRSAWLQTAIKSACLSQDNVVPPIIIGSRRVRPAEFGFNDAKRVLLQHPG